MVELISNIGIRFISLELFRNLFVKKQGFKEAKQVIEEFEKTGEANDQINELKEILKQYEENN